VCEIPRAITPIQSLWPEIGTFGTSGYISPGQQVFFLVADWKRETTGLDTNGHKPRSGVVFLVPNFMVLRFWIGH